MHQFDKPSNVFAENLKNPESNIKTTSGTENNKNIIDAIFGNAP